MCLSSRPSMPVRSSVDNAIVRVVPRVERDEFVNAVAIVFCRPRRFLGARIELDRPRLAALAPWLDPAEVERHLALIPLVCAGGADGGPIGLLPLADRFHWLVAPRSATIPRRRSRRSWHSWCGRWRVRRLEHRSRIRE